MTSLVADLKGILMRKLARGNTRRIVLGFNAKFCHTLLINQKLTFSFMTALWHVYKLIHIQGRTLACAYF